eukprot:m.139695 g.139695  ORF g.139695 m.139695 type:complete len:371 (-) comp17638_c0_seq1:179-1291(-)
MLSMMSAILFIGLVSTLAAPAVGCNSDLDCSLAGQCKSGACVCEKWTRGADCAELNLRNLSSASQLQAAVQPVDGFTTWGGSVVQDDDGLYHMFSAIMADRCSLSVWTFKSMVIHSTSTTPTGPFTKVDVAIPAEAHNPVLSRASDGTWLIWTCGCPNPSPAKECKHTAYTCPSNGQPATWTTTVYSSDSLNGPWKPHVGLLDNLTKGHLGSQNVSPLMGKDGTVHLMFKGPDNNTEASIAVAPHWSGPYSMVESNIFAKYFAANITNEDVWWWQTSDGNYHALSHRMEPTNRGSAASGGHAFATSMDDWSYASTPAYTTQVGVVGGGVVQLKRRERPQLLLGPDGTPKVLYNGVMDADGNAFTFAQVLG